VLFDPPRNLLGPVGLRGGELQHSRACRTAEQAQDLDQTVGVHFYERGGVAVASASGEVVQAEYVRCDRCGSDRRRMTRISVVRMRVPPAGRRSCSTGPAATPTRIQPNALTSRQSSVTTIFAGPPVSFLLG
jgi:hypothetical protein